MNKEIAKRDIQVSVLCEIERTPEVVLRVSLADHGTWCQVAIREWERTPEGWFPRLASGIVLRHGELGQVINALLGQWEKEQQGKEKASVTKSEVSS